MAIGWINSTVIVVLSPGMHISVPSGNVTVPGHVRRPEIELRTIVREERLVPAPLVLGQHIHLTLEMVCGVIDPGFANT